MDFKNLVERISQQYEHKLPFVVFSSENSETITCYCQNNETLYCDASLSKNGFVLAPFDSRLQSYLIAEEESERLETRLKPLEINTKSVTVSKFEEAKKSYQEFVRQTIDIIRKGEALKIVVSRKKEFPLSNFSIESLVERLFSAYPTAFRYIWYHPKTGIWCGATPETLVDIKKSIFKTMALAGTQPYKPGEVTWRKKELDEQYFVTEAILENLKGLVENVKVGPVETHRAGTLYHLKADITGALKEEPGILSKITNILHPTPAVCGTPQNYSRDFIIESEGYPREFYTGFTGPIEDNGTSASLMVNLRSMRIKDEVARVFVGGGVTIDSDVDEEWRETHNKMQTMLQVLQPML